MTTTARPHWYDEALFVFAFWLVLAVIGGLCGWTAGLLASVVFGR